MCPAINGVSPVRAEAWPEPAGYHARRLEVHLKIFLSTSLFPDLNRIAGNRRRVENRDELALCLTVHHAGELKNASEDAAVGKRELHFSLAIGVGAERRHCGASSCASTQRAKVQAVAFVGSAALNARFHLLLVQLFYLNSTL